MSGFIDFNPRSHERSDVLVRSGLRLSRDFNPRSHERSDGISVTPEAISEDFNPRSHERSDVPWSASVSPTVGISIHAPTRGATLTDCTFFVH